MDRPRDSWHFERWAFETRVGKGQAMRKLILSALAKAVDVASGATIIGQDALAFECETTDRTIRDHLKALESAGLIARRPRFTAKGRRTSDEILLLAPGVECWPDGTPIAAIQPEDASAGSAQPPEDPSAGSSSFPRTFLFSPTSEVQDGENNEKEKNETALSRTPARTREGEPPPYSFNGRRVPGPVREMAVSLVTEFALLTGQRAVKPFRPSNGKPTDSLTRVTGALLEHPDVSLERWRLILARVVENPPSWCEGSVAIGDVFGPRAVVRHLASDGRSGNARDVQRSAKNGVVSHRLAAIQAGR